MWLERPERKARRYGKDKKDDAMMRTLKEADNPMRLIRDEGRVPKKRDAKRTTRRGKK